MAACDINWSEHCKNWDDCVQSLVLKTGFTSAGIYGHDGKLWAQNSNSKSLLPTDLEITKILLTFDHWPQRTPRKWEVKSEMEMIDFTKIFPLEITLHIFGYLDENDLAKTVFVNKFWSELSNENKVWKGLYLLYFPTHKEREELQLRLLGKTNDYISEWVRIQEKNRHPFYWRNAFLTLRRIRRDHPVTAEPSFEVQATKYITIRSTPRTLIGKKFYSQGVICIKTNHLLIVGIYADNSGLLIHQFSVQIEAMADKLIESGF
eukprot:TRINITY_DN7891_c0_g1_i2.p1 TRINITY_DN7891_c0_g1~~TRINITY_DN7891_c0_g1_i2.p1  ORF type:complete len:263 (+),score=23.32 TRINITY_DN7891_c0_g1_i2:140-928(+)